MGKGRHFHRGSGAFVATYDCVFLYIFCFLLFRWFSMILSTAVAPTTQSGVPTRGWHPGAFEACSEAVKRYQVRLKSRERLLAAPRHWSALTGAAVEADEDLDPGGFESTNCSFLFFWFLRGTLAALAFVPFSPMLSRRAGICPNPKALSGPSDIRRPDWLRAWGRR